MRNSMDSSKEKPEILLIEYFKQKGYFRLPDEERKRELGKKYKKGYEIRFVAKTNEELKELRELIVDAGFKPGKPFRKGRQFVQPIYGKKAFERFLHLIKKLKRD